MENLEPLLKEKEDKFYFVNEEKPKKNKNKIVILLLLVMFVLVGCTKQLKSEDGKAVKNPTTGQSLTQNILCKPEDKETYEIYTKYKDEINLEELPSCKNFSITSGGYEGI